MLNHCQNSAMPNAVQNCTVLSERVDGFARTSQRASVQEKTDLFLWQFIPRTPFILDPFVLSLPGNFFSSLLRQYANNTLEKTIGNASYDIFMLHYDLWTWPNYFVVVQVVNMKCLLTHLWVEKCIVHIENTQSGMFFRYFFLLKIHLLWIVKI